MPVKQVKSLWQYGRMTSCPNSVGRWILMVGDYWQTGRQRRKKDSNILLVQKALKRLAIKIIFKHSLKNESNYAILDAY